MEEKRKEIEGKENKLRIKEEELKLRERESELEKKEKELKEKEEKGGCPAPIYGQAAWPCGEPSTFRNVKVKNK